MPWSARPTPSQSWSADDEPVLQLAAHGGEADYDRDPDELIRLAARAQWHRDPPYYVADWLAARYEKRRPR